MQSLLLIRIPRATRLGDAETDIEVSRLSREVHKPPPLKSEPKSPPMADLASVDWLQSNDASSVNSLNEHQQVRLSAGPGF